MIHSWQFKHYTDLSLDEFHDIISLRISVFVVEQDCPYQELDGKDKIGYHLIGKNEKEKIAGTLRVLPPGVSYDEVSIGRIVIHPEERGKEYGHKMMQDTMDFIRQKFGNVPIKLSAQKHLEQFYKTHNFNTVGKGYLEDGIPHILMEYKPKK